MWEKSAAQTRVTFLSLVLVSPDSMELSHLQSLEMLGAPQCQSPESFHLVVHHLWGIILFPVSLMVHGHAGVPVSGKGK